MGGKTRRHPRDVEHERLLALGTEDHYLDVELYDFEYADREDDVAWYLDRAQRYRAEAGAEAEADTPPILELGAGTGRITLPLCRAGHRVVALDRMPSMLDRLRAHLAVEPSADAVEVLEADMRELPLPDEHFGLVIAPFNTLMHLYTWRDLLACFREVHRVLVPGGTFAFDVELPDLEWLLWEPNKRHAVTPFTHPTTGEKLIYSTNHSYDPGTQVCHIRIYYDDAPSPGRRFRPPKKPRKLVHLAHREIFPEELRALVDTAGLTLESQTGDFEGVSLGPGVQSQVLVCRKG